MTVDFTGMTPKTCPNACTPNRCVITTVAICKHPYKSSPDGCGPITLVNREKAQKLLGGDKLTVSKDSQ